MAQIQGLNFSKFSDIYTSGRPINRVHRALLFLDFRFVDLYFYPYSINRFRVVVNFG